jgi:hypothetical protein
VKARPESMISSPMKIHGKKGSNGTYRHQTRERER